MRDTARDSVSAAEAASVRTSSGRGESRVARSRRPDGGDCLDGVREGSIAERRRRVKALTGVCTDVCTEVCTGSGAGSTDHRPIGAASCSAGFRVMVDTVPVDG